MLIGVPFLSCVDGIQYIGLSMYGCLDSIRAGRQFSILHTVISIELYLRGQSICKPKLGAFHFLWSGGCAATIHPTDEVGTTIACEAAFGGEQSVGARFLEPGFRARLAGELIEQLRKRSAFTERRSRRFHGMPHQFDDLKYPIFQRAKSKI